MTDKTVRAKARTGWVVGVLSLSGVVVALQQTLVVPVLPEWEPRREIIHVVFASRRGQLPALRALIDHLVDSFQALDED